MIIVAVLQGCDSDRDSRFNKGVDCGSSLPAVIDITLLRYCTVGVEQVEFYVDWASVCVNLLIILASAVLGGCVMVVCLTRNRFAIDRASPFYHHH